MERIHVVYAFSFLLVGVNILLVLDNSSGTFISASEDDAGILDAIEQKISKVTMIPRTHGEVGF